MKSREPFAIIDIGSNSVRLVVYAGAPRIPSPIFNEKVLAGLGEGLDETGKLSASSQGRALAALRRYWLLLCHMKVKRMRVVATAAVRDASNGHEFVQQVREIGFDCQVLSAADEARLSGEGVLSAVPGADGIVGDLGGGSLELAEVREGKVGTAISLPLGVLRVSDNPAGERRALDVLRSALKQSGLAKNSAGRPFYMVGGSWRALARIDMLATEFPLPIKHQYAMAPKRAAALRQIIGSLDSQARKAIAPARLATSPMAAMLLTHLADELRPSELILSSFGIREGMLFEALSKHVRAQDPLIEAARDSGEAERRFGEHGDILNEWIAPLFDDRPEQLRIRLASCLLADIAWQANPDFRADRGIEMALHGNWVGVDAAGRVMMAQALSSNFGRDRLPDESLAKLCSGGEIERARQWGMAMRLGQRLSGGVGAALAGTRLALDGDSVRLEVRKAQDALVGEPVRKRLARLADALGREPKVVLV